MKSTTLKDRKFGLPLPLVQKPFPSWFWPCTLEWNSRSCSPLSAHQRPSTSPLKGPRDPCPISKCLQPLFSRNYMSKSFKFPNTFPPIFVGCQKTHFLRWCDLEVLIKRLFVTNCMFPAKGHYIVANIEVTGKIPGSLVTTKKRWAGVGIEKAYLNCAL